MDYRISEIFDFIVPTSADKKLILMKEFEKGFFFDHVSFGDRVKDATFIRLNDVLFEDDPFRIFCIEFAGYLDDRYTRLAYDIVKFDRYKSVRLTYEIIERYFDEFGLSDRSKIYDAMNTVKKIINPSRYCPNEAELEGSFELKHYELNTIPDNQ